MIIDAAELKRRYSQRIAGVGDKKVYIGPEIVTLEISDPCTLRCQYCSSSHAPGNPDHFKKGRFLSWEKFVGIVRDCVDLNVDQINIVGEGEPTIHPLFREMMRHLEQQPLRIMLLTNATFPLDYCSDVIRADHVLINFGAVDRQQYRDLHGKDFFGRVVKNIKRLATLRDNGKPGFLIDIAYIVNSMNIDQKQKMGDLACRLGVRKLHFTKMSPTQYNKGIALDKSLLGDEKKRTPAACLNGWFYMVATSDGKLSTCYRIYQMSHGDLNKESFKNIWLSPHMMKLRLLGKYGYIQKKNKVCQVCPFYEENIGLLQNQSFWKPDLRQMTF